MNDRTKNVTIGAAEYQLRRVTPAVGGYLWHRLMWACNKAAQAARHDGDDSTDNPMTSASLEQRLRTICAIGFMQMDLADYEKAQAETLKATSRVDAATGLPMPLMASDGRWAAGTDDIQADPFVVTQIITESLVFNLAPYLAGSSPTPAKS